MVHLYVSEEFRKKFKATSQVYPLDRVREFMSSCNPHQDKFSPVHKTIFPPPFDFSSVAT